MTRRTEQRRGLFCSPCLFGSTCHACNSVQSDEVGAFAGLEPTDFLVSSLEDPSSGLSAEWDREHDRLVLRRLMEIAKPEFQPKTWRAFCLLVLEGRPVAFAAGELGMTANAVLIAKSRILQRLGQEAGCLID